MFSSALSELATAIDFTVTCPLLPSYLTTAIADPQAVIALRAHQKTAKHASGSAARGRAFLPWVLTTFGAMGPAGVWYLVDSIYASSASLARLNRTSLHSVARRKAAFLATLQATLTRTCYRMLTTHTAHPPTATSAATAPPPPPVHPDPASPESPDDTSPDAHPPDDTPPIDDPLDGTPQTTTRYHRPPPAPHPQSPTQMSPTNL